jgi:hypothetical protein
MLATNVRPGTAAPNPHRQGRRSQHRHGRRIRSGEIPSDYDKLANDANTGEQLYCDPDIKQWWNQIGPMIGVQTIWYLVCWKHVLAKKLHPPMGISSGVIRPAVLL